jgi:hypothetical protein
MGKKREQESEREREKDLQTKFMLFPQKQKVLTQTVSNSMKFSSSELGEGMKKMGEVGSTSK